MYNGLVHAHSGLRWLETDLHLSSDGHVMCIHDDTVDRTTDGTGPVSDFTASALESLDAAFRFEIAGDHWDALFDLSLSGFYHQRSGIALTEGQANEGIEVVQLPEDVLELLASASANILETEGQKGERAAKAADVYRTLMKDMGYV